MLKRTQGRLLLTLLVITGLAGTLNNTSLSGKERKFAIGLMKDTKADVFKSVKGLSEAQLNFKAGPNHWSVKECTYHIAVSEKNLWNLLEVAIKSPANPEKRSEIKMTDEVVVKMMENQNTMYKTFELKKTPYKSLNEALESFKTQRGEHIKYLKSTTEDLRNHVIQMPFGWLDCYQLCLMIASYSNWYKQQIDEVKADPGFPKH
ncbi:MAG TPA: DinB family protein [Chitinophagaceae bacterium]|nr:DinB family protein [Chitinophagaceae bacterium]